MAKEWKVSVVRKHVHVYPIHEDEPRHEMDKYCWCGPRVIEENLDAISFSHNKVSE